MVDPVHRTRNPFHANIVVKSLGNKEIGIITNQEFMKVQNPLSAIIVKKHLDIYHTGKAMKGKGGNLGILGVCFFYEVEVID